MAWLVENLLRNKLVVKEKADLESDEYNNLLVLEGRINELSSNGVITKEELDLIGYLEDGLTLQMIANVVHRDRVSVSKDVKKLTDKLAFHLGGDFTDEGFLDHMAEDYKLTETQISLLRSFMKGKFKNKLMRKTNDV